MAKRYLDLVLRDGQPGRWQRQEIGTRGGAFGPAESGPIGVKDIDRMLRQQCWIGMSAPAEGYSRHVALDIDVKTEAARSTRDERYWAARRAIGLGHRPLVWRTPSGAGLRVLWAIPRTPVDALTGGSQRGLVEIALEATGVRVHAGQVEVFPRRTQIDRLPLGRSMSFLDPDTLAAVPGVEIGDEYDPSAIERGLDIIERWQSAPCMGLVDRLHGVATGALAGLRAAQVADRAEAHQAAGHLSAEVRRIVDHGLTAPGSRHRLEWIVGLAVILHPQWFTAFGPLDTSDDRSVARVLARWLAARNNGHSHEWTRYSHGSPARGIAYWTNRYLAKDRQGQTMIGRLRAAAASFAPSGRYTLLASPQERDRAWCVASGLTNPPARFRAEVWLVSLFHSIRRVVSYHHYRGSPCREVEGPDCGPGVEVEIAARWMRNFQFGAGKGYVRHRELAYDGRELRLVAESPARSAYRWGEPRRDDMPRQAARYAARAPQFSLSASILGVDPSDVARAIRGSRFEMWGRAISLDTAVHLLWLTRAEGPALDLAARYGRGTAETIRRLADGIRREMENLARLRAHPAGRPALAPGRVQLPPDLHPALQGIIDVMLAA